MNACCNCLKRTLNWMLSNNCIFPPALIAPFPPQDERRFVSQMLRTEWIRLFIIRPDIPEIQNPKNPKNPNISNIPLLVWTPQLVWTVIFACLHLNALDWSLIQLTASCWLPVLVSIERGIPLKFVIFFWIILVHFDKLAALWWICVLLKSDGRHANGTFRSFGRQNARALLKSFAFSH